ncbi:MAG: DUF3833 domain-containing protein [Alphaproteobacteria bacterium]|nr:DUF3833 domain-containing protein [Alphaproteobacteria bacterium]MCY4229335.1 DUF3833 domain-containing protein [Alphaproteobacteria bacterium]MCY4320270.1 DUF3833 domain-containing protein [Alphaproteobacteria bacterium]
MRTRHFPGSGFLFDLGSQSVDDYAAETPVLDLRDYLSGPLSACGVFFGLSGRAERRFTVDMIGRWLDGKGTLDERFRYDDGRIDERCWSLTFSGDGTFTATAHDVEGEATGVQRGNAAMMRYRLRVPRAKGDIVVSMEDWFYLMDDGRLINRARMSKFGLKVGELFVSFSKATSAAGAP